MLNEGERLFLLSSVENDIQNNCNTIVFTCHFNVCNETVDILYYMSLFNIVLL